MQFLCDKMLGRLANWLRILGYDTVYASNTDKRAIIECAINENRVLLTRNTRLPLFKSIRNCEYLFIEHDSFREQLVQIVAKYDLKFENSGRICARCNIALQETSKRSIERIIPVYVAHKQEKFLRCPECHRVYWPATHKSSINAEIREICKRAGKQYNFPVEG